MGFTRVFVMSVLEPAFENSREAVNENIQAKLNFRCSYHCEEQFSSALVKDQLGYQISRL